jgi:dihydrofolate synthase/folylpolyglutamate synthase
VNYPDSVQFLYSLGNEIKTAKLGLGRIRAVLEALGRPQDRLRFVHVAGTNGKGSTCAMVESALRGPGFRTGLFTSPHLAEPTERIRIDGHPIAAERFAEAFDRVHAVNALENHTTYFETVTAMALLVFAEEEADMVVLEVGLGGRLDATNVVSPELCVITPVDFDHEAFLGKSLESIAGEKAGILKPGVPAVFARQRPEAARVLEQRAAELAIPVAWTSDWPVSDLDLDARGSRFRLSGERELRVTCPLAGEHQVENAVTAAVALTRLGVADSAIETGIARALLARPPGACVREPRDHPRRRPQSRRRPRPGGIHRPLLLRTAGCA